MAIGVKVGREATHGTIAGTLTSVACGFSSKLNQNNKVLEEGRNGQDVNFQAVTGPNWEAFSVADSYVYHDTIGMWLASALGTPTKAVAPAETIVWDNTFKFADDPKSLSLQWTQPRRITQSFQALYGVVDKMTITFDIGGELSYSLSGVAMSRTDIAPPTFTFTAVRPFAAWAGAVTLQGSAAGVYADLIKGSVVISRNRAPFHTIRNNRAPRSMTIGNRTVDVDLTVDFDSIGEFDSFRNGLQDNLLIKWVDAGITIGTAVNPEFELSIPSLYYEDGGEDIESPLPSMNLKGKALYNAASASSLVARVRSTIDYTL